MRSGRRGLNPLGVACVLALCAPGAVAQAQDLDRGGALALILENDLVSGRDRNYTGGAKLAFVSGEQHEESIPGWLGRTLLRADPEDASRFGLAIGQSLFTPDDLEKSVPLPEQQPYAGWLYAELALHVVSERSLDTLSLEIGVVGPNAGGERIQREIHDLSGTGVDPQGWDNQLGNELAGVLTLERTWRALSTGDGNGLGIELLPRVGASLGNVRTQATAGLTLRLGSDLLHDFGPARVRPAIAGPGFSTSGSRFGGYAFAGVSGRAVAYNIFLDGNTMRRSLEVDREPFVGDFEAGIVLDLLDVRLALTVVSRSKEFDTQRSAHMFGAVSLSMQL